MRFYGKLYRFLLFVLRKFLFKFHPEVAKEFAAKEKRAGGHKAYIRMSKKQKRNLSRGYA